MHLIVAFSTEDGQQLINDHFGEGLFFPIYRINETSAIKLKTIENTTGEEEHHGESRKAQEISQLMKPHNVQVLCGKQFGPNIVRMVKKFLPVVVNVSTVEQAIELLQKHYTQLLTEWQKGENRKHLVIR